MKTRKHVVSSCGSCGRSIRPRGKFHRCRACGTELGRARLTDAWKVIRLPQPFCCALCARWESETE